MLMFVLKIWGNGCAKKEKRSSKKCLLTLERVFRQPCKQQAKPWVLHFCLVLKAMRSILSFVILLSSLLLFCVADAEEDYSGFVVLPAIGLGTAAMRGETTESVVTEALNLGVRLFDTAQAQEWYDEAAVGRAVARFVQQNPNVPEPLIVTKIHPRSYGLEDMRRELSKSYVNFASVGLTAVLLHAPFCWQGHCNDNEMVDWRDGWRNLEELKDEFDIRYIGVSNFDADQIKELVEQIASKKVALVQNWMDPLHQDFEVRNFCQENRIQYMAYSSFGTQWSSSSKASGGNPVLTSDVLQEVAKRHGKTVTEVVLEWLSVEGVVALPRTTNPAHLASNFQICSRTEWCTDSAVVTFSSASFLDDEDIQQIRELDGTLGSPWD
ncbi:aldo/keto reductase [archaeon]|nr:MAG: aldo/keto reductase [archaeon]